MAFVIIFTGCEDKLKNEVQTNDSSFSQGPLNNLRSITPNGEENAYRLSKKYRISNKFEFVIDQSNI